MEWYFHLLSMVQILKYLKKNGKWVQTYIKNAKLV